MLVNGLRHSHFDYRFIIITIDISINFLFINTRMNDSDTITSLNHHTQVMYIILYSAQGFTFVFIKTRINDSDTFTLLNQYSHINLEILRVQDNNINVLHNLFLSFIEKMTI